MKIRSSWLLDLARAFVGRSGPQDLAGVQDIEVPATTQSIFWPCAAQRKQAGFVATTAERFSVPIRNGGAAAAGAANVVNIFTFEPGYWRITGNLTVRSETANIPQITQAVELRFVEPAGTFAPFAYCSPPQTVNDLFVIPVNLDFLIADPGWSLQVNVPDPVVAGSVIRGIFAGYVCHLL